MTHAGRPCPCVEVGGAKLRTRTLTQPRTPPAPDPATSSSGSSRTDSSSSSTGDAPPRSPAAAYDALYRRRRGSTGGAVPVTGHRTTFFGTGKLRALAAQLDLLDGSSRGIGSGSSTGSSSSSGSGSGGDSGGRKQGLAPSHTAAASRNATEDHQQERPEHPEQESARLLDASQAPPRVGGRPAGGGGGGGPRTPAFINAVLTPLQVRGQAGWLGGVSRGGWVGGRTAG